MNLVALTVENDEEREWLEAHAYADAWQWMGLDTLVVDVRCAPELIEGARAEGFSVT